MKFHPFIRIYHSLAPLYDRKFHGRLGNGPSRGHMTVAQLFYRHGLDARVWNLYFLREMQVLGFRNQDGSRQKNRFPSHTLVDQTGLFVPVQ